MKRLYIFISLISITLGLQAQETILLEGQVLNDTIDKASLNVVNISLKEGTTTTDSGLFKIKARVNDTINISAVQYEPRQFVVNQTMYNRKKITLYLVPKITELDNVNISNIDLSGNLDKDVTETKVKVDLRPSDLGIPENTAPERTVEERRYYTAVTSGSGIPLDGLINAITGRLKMLKTHIEVSRFQAKVEKYRYKFSDTLYMKSLDIPEDLILDFVYYVFEDPESDTYAQADDVYGLFEFMMKKSKAYLALREEKRD